MVPLQRNSSGSHLRRLGSASSPRFSACINQPSPKPSRYRRYRTLGFQGPRDERVSYTIHCVALASRTVPGDDLEPRQILHLMLRRLLLAVAVVAGHGSVLSTRKGYVARLNLHSLKWDDLSFSNEPPALSHAAFETGSPQVARKQTCFEGSRSVA